MKALLAHLKTMWHALRQNLCAVLLCIVVPFVLSHLVVLQARQIGMPYRLILDAVHGFIVLSYLTVIVRQDFQGVARFGFAIPKPRWQGIKPLVLATVAVLVIGFPVALALHPLTQGLEAIADERGGLWAYIPTIMLPEFTMTTLVGLALAAGTGKVNS